MRRIVKGCLICRLSFGLLTLGLLYIPATAVGAREVVIIDFGQAQESVPPGWELSEQKGKADVALVPDQEGQALRLRSNSSSFSIGKKLDIDPKESPLLEWQWKVTELPQEGDFRDSARNDQAAQLLVVFHWATFKKQVIAYIWDSTAPKETTRDDPSSSYVPFLAIKTVVVGSGDAERGRWITETRNVVEDYKKLFGAEPNKVRGIRIRFNSQHTKSNAEALWRYVMFKAQP